MNRVLTYATVCSGIECMSVAAQVRKLLAKISNPSTCHGSPRYKACGNSWATNQPRWILTRLLAKEGVEW